MGKEPCIGDASSQRLHKVRSPVVIGGLGGSGTRLIALLLDKLGFYMGSDLNVAHDNLWFSFLFKRRAALHCPEHHFKQLAGIMATAMSPGEKLTWLQRLVIRAIPYKREQHYDKEWLSARCRSLLDSGLNQPAEVCLWGWKEPNSHMFIDRLKVCFPHMKYIHVVRNGLDMAFSRNQNQPRIWGQEVLGEPFSATPRYALRFWCEIHRNIMAKMTERPEQYLWINFDRFCSNPHQEFSRILNFLGAHEHPEVRRMLDTISPPVSVGRFRGNDLSQFAASDIDYVKALGFPVHE